MSDRNIGSNFDDFLAEEDLLAEVEATAIKRVIVYQLQQAMNGAKISRIEMAHRMNTSESIVDDLLNPDNSAVNLQLISQAASALGKTLKLELI